MKLIKTGDKILIATIILASIISIFSIPLLFSRPLDEKEVVIHLDGEVIHRFPLIESEVSEFIDFPFAYGGKEYTGKLEMKDGRVMLHRLPNEISPLSIHTDMGWISESYQMIVSLPIKLFITIEAPEPNELIDIIVN